MLKILQGRLQQYMNLELPDIQAGFRKGRTGDQIENIHWIVEKETEFQKNIYFCFIDYAKAFDSVDHKKLWKILRNGNTRPPYLHIDFSRGRSGGLAFASCSEFSTVNCAPHSQKALAESIKQK